MTRLRADLILLIAALVWGLGFVAQSTAMDNIGPFTFIGLRFLIAAAAVWPLMRFIEIIEQAVGREAVKKFEPMQAGDVYATYADIDAISADYGFAPTTPLEAGIPKFVEWYKEYRKSAGGAA